MIKSSQILRGAPAWFVDRHPAPPQLRQRQNVCLVSWSLGTPAFTATIQCEASLKITCWNISKHNWNTTEMKMQTKKQFLCLEAYGSAWELETIWLWMKLTRQELVLQLLLQQIAESPAEFNTGFPSMKTSAKIGKTGGGTSRAQRLQAYCLCPLLQCRT